MIVVYLYLTAKVNLKPNRKNYFVTIMLLKNKIALVTGASRGIGRGIALQLAEQGAFVAFTYLSSPEKAMELENELKAKNIKAKGYQSNAADFAAAEKLINDVIADFGTIDILVNNAGITRDNLLMRMTEAQFDEVVNTNLKSAFNTTKHVQRTMLKQRSGSIINITSVVGAKGNAGQSNYAASKAGIIGFTKSVALELGSRSIRCNAIAPGFIGTEMTATLDQNIVNGWIQQIPMKRTGTVDDIANAVVFLASDMSAYITGQVLHVNGGMYT